MTQQSIKSNITGHEASNILALLKENFRIRNCLGLFDEERYSDSHLLVRSILVFMSKEILPRCYGT